MLSIKDPKIPIKPLDSNIAGINLEKAIERFNSSQIPEFLFLDDSALDYHNNKKGWQLLADIIKPREKQGQRFWKLVEKLSLVKNKYNEMIQ